MDWANFINKVTDTSLSVYQNREMQKHELAKIELQQRAADGRAYIEGQRDALGATVANVGGFEITPGLMLAIGAVVVLAVVLKD